MLASLGLRSARALRCFGGRNSFAMLRTWISEKEPEDCRMRGSRLLDFGGTLCEVCGVFCVGCAGDSGARTGVPGLLVWGIHSSDRSSSHGCVVLAMAVCACVCVCVQMRAAEYAGGLACLGGWIWRGTRAHQVNTGLLYTGRTHAGGGMAEMKKQKKRSRPTGVSCRGGKRVVLWTWIG